MLSSFHPIARRTFSLGVMACLATLSHAVGAATTANAAANTHVPWLNVPVNTPSQSKQQITAQRACADADLQIVAGQKGARKGFATQELIITNQSAEACFLNGVPGVQLLPPNAAPQTLGAHADATTNLLERNDLAPGDKLVVLLGTPGACDAAIGPQRKVANRLSVISPGGGKRNIEGVHVDTLCGGAKLLHAQLMRHELPSATPFSQLSASLSVAETVAPGDILHYTVTLTNDGNAAVSLTPCPVYNSAISSGETSTLAGFQLNCAATAHKIAAGASVSYDVQLMVPASLSGKSAKLSWELQGGPGVGAIVPIK